MVSSDPGGNPSNGERVPDERRSTGRHGFQNRKRQPFKERRQNEKVAGGQQVGHVGAVAEQAHPLGEAQRGGLRFQRGMLGALAGQYELRLRDECGRL